MNCTVHYILLLLLLLLLLIIIILVIIIISRKTMFPVVTLWTAYIWT